MVKPKPQKHKSKRHPFLGELSFVLNQRQQDAIEYLHEENRILREQLGGKRLRFNDDQRPRLAVRAKKLGSSLPEISAKSR